MGKIRVLVVEDSLTVRKHLVEVLQSDPDFDVIAEAGDGKRAVELCQSLRPDVMTLDMMLPEMTGVAVTEYVMAFCPLPILIVSASVNRGEAFRTYDALAAGALDVLEKPLADDAGDAWDEKLRSTVKLVSRIKVITHLRARLERAPSYAVPAVNPETRYDLVMIGASTGGPAAVSDILRALPVNFPLPILLVIHIAKAFAPALAEWLDGQSPLRVRYAREGELLPQEAGNIIMAPPDVHMVLSRGRLYLKDGPERHACRPSIDVLFESVACEPGRRPIACLLTGMGKDGALGMLAARRAGAFTIAQDEASSVVFGMPGEAVRLGAVERVLPLKEIAPTLVELVRAANPTITGRRV
jgi:two-component system chemotaxis response regulator CheB